ncbi:hypothetical protein [Aeromonas dhakensis]|uniref:hypothetical protein n=1 Tax=Aeromonas dhakensis TaxID=196024 RepID=UPI003987CD4F
MTDWVKVREAALAAAKKRLGVAWSNSAGIATAQISALVEVAHYIEDNKDELSEANYQHLMKLQKQALVDALTGIEIISITAAQNAAADAMDVIIKALPGLILAAV